MNLLSPSPKQLAKGIRNGDHFRFRQFYEAYKGFIYTRILCLEDRREMADELFQKVLVKISTSSPRWNTEAELKAWLRSVVRSVVFDDLRKQKRLPFESRSFSDLDSDLECLEILEQQQSVRIIENLNSALGKLSIEDLTVVRAVYIDREPRTEVAERLGVSYKALESRLVRLRKKLKQMILEGSGNE